MHQPGGPQKITFGEMRASGVCGVLIYCSDYHYSHWITMSADRWPDCFQQWAGKTALPNHWHMLSSL
jgi:hypothetical protein